MKVEELLIIIIVLLSLIIIFKIINGSLIEGIEINKYGDLKVLGSAPMEDECLSASNLVRTATCVNLNRGHPYKNMESSATAQTAPREDECLSAINLVRTATCVNTIRGHPYKNMESLV